MSDGESPLVMLCGAQNYAMFLAMLEFEGRNWRRLKREMNKAARRARLDARMRAWNLR